MNPSILAVVFLVAAGVARADLPTQRVAATTITLPSTPPPATTNGYETTNAFPGLTFSQPIAAAVPPGETNRLFVVLRTGTIQVITNLANPTAVNFLNINGRVSTSGEGGLLGLAFHPDYASNRYFYVYYTSATVFQDRVSRFQASLTNAAFADPATETVLYSQLDQADNHNAGDLHFGPDGYLYVAAGDEGGGNDSWNNAQKIDQDFFSGIFRIDVDKKPGSLSPNPHPAINAAVTNYAIPPGNPYINATNFLGSNLVPDRVRTEFFAVGLRNPFRFTFDPVNGRLLCADVGQGLWRRSTGSPMAETMAGLSVRVSLPVRAAPPIPSRFSPRRYWPMPMVPPPTRAARSPGVSSITETGFRNCTGIISSAITISKISGR